MKSPVQQKIHRFLRLDYKTRNDIWLTNQYTLRTLIGILGVLLPVFLWIFLFIDAGSKEVLPSVSHYYYTRASSVFILILGLMGIFLLVYKGHDPIDFYISFIAGIAALLVILFPTDNLSAICCPGDPDKNAVTMLNKNPFRENFHFGAAGVFLCCLAVMAFFLFTRSNVAKAKRSKAKKAKNVLYRFCAIVMVLAMLVVLAGVEKIGIINRDFYEAKHLTFWMEVVAVEMFGIAWLVKGRQ
jgi:hypothetical protein